MKTKSRKPFKGKKQTYLLQTSQNIAKQIHQLFWGFILFYQPQQRTIIQEIPQKMTVHLHANSIALIPLQNPWKSIQPNKVAGP